MPHITWGYDEDDTRRGQWLEASLQRANAKARLIAANLGVQLLGVHRFSEACSSSEDHYREAMAEYGGMRPSAARAMDLSTGMEISHSKSVFLRVEVEYRISPFQPDSR
jgi:uncharacterized protein YggE